MASALTYRGPRRLRANQLFRAELIVTPDRPIRPGGRAVSLRVIVRDATGAAPAVRAALKPEDAYGNVASEAPGRVALLLDGRAPAGHADLIGGRAAAVELPAPRDGLWHTLTAATDDGEFFETSNPFGPSDVEGVHLYFGEIHGQSALCDGTNDPEEIYAYARDAAGLDFAAVTSHDFELTAHDWDRIRRATRAANRPGQFVTFLGYEWSGRHPAGGDHNVYFLDDDGPLVHSAPFGGHPQWDPAEGQVAGRRDLSQTVAALAGRDVMIVPHGGGRRCNLDFHDPACMPLLEIHSCHRTYEPVAHEAIGRGLRVGFIGGSDDHRGALGDSHPAARDRFFSAHSGLVGVYAAELTRRALWEAFFARRTYATNGPRIVLDVRVNDVLMGGELRAAAGEPVEVAIRVRCDGLLDRVELIRGTRAVRHFVGPRNQVRAFEAEHAERAPAQPTAYWVRAVQTDGGTAWSSPVWVRP
jgi:hypothetical protein